MTKSVRFSDDITIIPTYSSDEYDRSCFAFSEPMPISYTFRPPTPPKYEEEETVIITSNNNRPMIKPLNLSLVPNSRRRALDSPFEETPIKKTRKPKLTINTQFNNGPLFFTGLSTHYKCKEEEEEQGYLIPVC
ncbi:hypothetical protein K501DRAFT_215905 [Backusella circina FSU 941]|nr:hypothetical protein K501DRAFT_215905 [Backusella circina FSU 941]